MEQARGHWRARARGTRVGLQSPWPHLAAIVIVSLPIVILSAASQRQLIRARFMGSVKR